MEPIYHITTAAAWGDAQRATRYAPASLDAEGFIHLSTGAQLMATAHRFYRGQGGLVVLVVDPGAVTADLRYEAATDGEGIFPHLYGALDVDAVRQVLPLRCAADGSFVSPFS